MHALQQLLLWLADTRLYHALIAFIAIYPIVTCVVWIIHAIAFYFRNERSVHPKNSQVNDPNDLPLVSILVAAYCEELVIKRTVRSLLDITYPKKEIVVVDDGSPDATSRILEPYARAGQVRLIRKLHNEGKAMALNYAIPLLRGELVLILDADIQPQPDILDHLVPHFQNGRVAAVTGNSQVTNTRSLLAKVQATEFASIVSVLRRAQRVWGRVLTVSGAVAAFRKAAIVDVGMFDPDMATEDIALSWKLQLRVYDIRYEPRAVVQMVVPETLGGLWTQRRRWALGLAQVLRKHIGIFRSWRTRRFWPIYIDACISIAWAYALVAMTGFWALSYATGLKPLGTAPIPNFWGLVIATLALGSVCKVIARG